MPQSPLLPVQSSGERELCNSHTITYFLNGTEFLWGSIHPRLEKEESLNLIIVILSKPNSFASIQSLVSNKIFLHISVLSVCPYQLQLCFIVVMPWGPAQLSLQEQESFPLNFTRAGLEPSKRHQESILFSSSLLCLRIFLRSCSLSDSIILGILSSKE